MAEQKYCKIVVSKEVCLHYVTPLRLYLCFTDPLLQSITLQPTRQTLPSSGHASLSCKVDANLNLSKSTISWFKDGALLLLSNDTKYTQLPNGVLVIHSLRRKDAGSYSCKVYSSLLRRNLVSNNANLTVGKCFVLCSMCRDFTAILLRKNWIPRFASKALLFLLNGSENFHGDMFEECIPKWPSPLEARPWAYLCIPRPDFVYLIQKPSRGHYNFCIFIAQMYAVTPQLTNQINKIRETEL